MILEKGREELTLSGREISQVGLLLESERNEANETRSARRLAVATHMNLTSLVASLVQQRQPKPKPRPSLLLLGKLATAMSQGLRQMLMLHDAQATAAMATSTGAMRDLSALLICFC